MTPKAAEYIRWKLATISSTWCNLSNRLGDKTLIVEADLHVSELIQYILNEFDPPISTWDKIDPSEKIAADKVFAIPIDFKSPTLIWDQVDDVVVPIAIMRDLIVIGCGFGKHYDKFMQRYEPLIKSIPTTDDPGPSTNS